MGKNRKDWSLTSLGAVSPRRRQRAIAWADLETWRGEFLSTEPGLKGGESLRDHPRVIIMDRMEGKAFFSVGDSGKV